MLYTKTLHEFFIIEYWYCYIKMSNGIDELVNGLNQLQIQPIYFTEPIEIGKFVYKERDYVVNDTRFGDNNNNSNNLNDQEQPLMPLYLG